MGRARRDSVMVQGRAQDAAKSRDVSVIIVNYNSAPLLVACLRALEGATRTLRVETIVVDNGSTDSSLELLRTVWQPTRLIAAGRNLGFSRAVNLGARAARGRYLLLLNTDCFVRPGLLDHLLRRLAAQSRVAVVGPRLRNADGSLQPSCHNFPTPWVLFLEQSLLWRLLRRVPVLRERLYLARDHRHPAGTDWLTGACLLIRADAFAAVGGLDERFFFYWEETDLCLQLRRRGWQTFFEPAAEAVHLGGGSGTNPALLRQFFQSLFAFYAKNYPGYWQALARAIVWLMASVKAGRAAGAAFWPGPGRARQAALADMRQWLGVVGR